MAGSAAAAVRARRRRRRRRRAIAGSVAVVVVAGGAGTAWAVQGADGPAYRLATATTASVSQTVDADGSLAAERVAQATFGVGGTVKRVDVEVGDRVTAGQTLALLDTTSLDAAVTSAETAVAQAQQRLTDAENGIVDTATGGGGGANTTATQDTGNRTTDSVSAVRLTASVTPTPAGSGSAGRAPAGGGTSSGTSSDSTSGTGSGRGSAPGSGTSLAAARARVESAATALTTAITALQSRAANACAVVTGTTGATVPTVADADGDVTVTLGTVPVTLVLEHGSPATQVATSGATPISSADHGATYRFTGLTAGDAYAVAVEPTSVADPTACAAVAKDTTVAADLKAFDDAVSALVTAAGTAGGGSSGSAGSSGLSGSGASGRPTGGGSGGSGASGGSTAGRGGTSAGTGTATRTGTTGIGSASRSGTTGSGTTSAQATTITAEQIAADTAAVTEAKAQLAVARRQRASATLTSPIAGTVATVGTSAGDPVSADSTSSAITVVGTGALSVELSVPLAKIDLVKLGQSADVEVDGRSTALPAEVTFVGTLDSSTSGSPTYPVTVQLDASAAGLFDGMGAQVSIHTGTARNAVTVPLSAVHTTGTRSTVDVYRGGTVTPTAVTLGVVGSSSVQITRGLTAGTRVVLADTSQPVPSSTSTTTRFGRTGGGAFPGGFGGGAFPGGTGGRAGGR